MILKLKKEIIAIILIICMLFTVSAISAADSNIESVSATNSTVEVMGVDLANDKNLAMENNVESLGETDAGDITALISKISAAGEGVPVYLENNYSVTGYATISQSITVDGQGHTIDGNGNYRAFYMNTAGINVIFKNIKFTNCKSKSSGGGAIYASSSNKASSIEIINCTFEDNVISGYNGGGVYLGATNYVKIINSTFIGNKATGTNKYAGAAYIGGSLANCEIINSTFINNAGTGTYGGAVYISASTHVNILNSTFRGNNATGSSKYGGAVYIGGNPANCEIINSTFNNNLAYTSGAVYIMGKSGSDYIVDGCVFTNNKASNMVSAIYVASANLYVNNSVFLDNDLSAVYISSATFNADNNWWGNTEENFDSAMYSLYNNKKANDWLFLKMETDGATGTATISLNNLYSSGTGQSSVYDANLPSMKFNIEGTNINVDKNSVKLDNEGKATFHYELIGSVGYLTVSYNNIELTKVIKDLSFSSLKSMIVNSQDPIIYLEDDFTFDDAKDGSLGDGIDFAKSVTIDGQGHTLDAKDLKRIFYINDPTKGVVLKNINFINGNADVGGAIYAVVNSLTLINCTFINNSANNHGSAIFINSQNAGEIKECIFTNNTKNSIIYCTGEGNYNIHDSIFINNEGLAVDGVNTANINANYNWWGNTAEDYGTSIVNVGTSVTRENWLFLNMTTDNKNALAEISLNNLYTIGVGNSTYSDYALPEITLNITASNAKVNKNNVKIDKTGKYSVSYVVKTTGSISVSYNDEIELTKDVTYDDNGNFQSLNNLLTNIAGEGDTLELKWDYTFDSSTDSQFISNPIKIQKNLVIDGQGHTIDAKSKTNIVVYNAEVIFKNIIFINGYSAYGGAVYYNSNLEGEFINCTFINNFAYNKGGAICNYPGRVTIAHSTFINNTASGGGSAIYSYNNVDLSYSILIGNTGGNVIDGSGVTANNNWWGHTIDNYETPLSVGSSVTANNWYVLDMSVDISTISKLTLNNLYDGNAISIDNNCALPTITFNTKSSNTQLTRNNVTLNDAGEGSIEHTFSKKYSITAGYNGVEITKSFVNCASFTELKTQINSDTSELILDQNYVFNPNVDNPDDIIFSKTLTIDGVGFTIDARGLSNIFHFDDDSNTKILILKNIIFANATGDNGAAVYFNGNRIEIINCTFINNTASGHGAAVYVGGANNNVENKIIQSTFINNTCDNSIIYLNSAFSDASFVVSDSIIVNNNGVTIAIGTGNVNANYNWWGNNATNYNANIANVGDGISIEKWFYLNITVDDEINKAKISLNNLNDESSYNYVLPELIFDISFINATSNKNNIILDSTGKATVDYSLTGLNGLLSVSYNGAGITNEIKFIDKGDFDSLQKILNLIPEGYMYTLNKNYAYSENDKITTGILVDKTIAVNGNGFTIDAKGKSRIFNLAADDILLKNIKLVNGKSDSGAAVYTSSNYVNVDNCTFINNTASGDGGAIYINSYYSGSITNSKFINNSANEDGAAIFTYAYYASADINRCIFINNTASESSVIYAYKCKVQNSIFLDNPGNMIRGYYSDSHVIKYNWFGNTFDNYTDFPSMVSPVTGWLYLNIKFYEDYAVVSLNKLYDKNSDSSSIISNYNLPEITLNINSTTLNLNNKKNITLDSKGTAKVPYALIGDTGALTVSYGDISLTKERVIGEFDILQDLINNNDEIELDRDYTYVPGVDEIIEGIIIDKNITIDGKGHTIDAKEMTRIFNVQATGVTFKNIVFANGKSNLGYDGGGDNGGAIYYNVDNSLAINFNVENCTFVNNTANMDLYYFGYQGGAIYIKANGGSYNIKNSAFINNNARGDNGGAIYLNIKDSIFDLYNSSFIKNKAVNNGALYIETDNTETTIDKCLFKENAISSSSYSSTGSAILWKTTNDNGNNVVKNSIFIDNNGSSVKNNFYVFSFKSGSVNIDDNWWGTTAQNRPETFESFFIGGDLKPNSWLFIKSDVSSNRIKYNETATIKYYLQAHDGTTVSEFDNTKLPYVDFNVGCDVGTLDKNKVSLNEEFTYRATDAGNDLIDIYCNSIVYETTIFGPYIIPIVDVPFVMYANQGLSKKHLIKTADGNYNSVTLSCNDSSLLNLGGNYDVSARTTEGTALLEFHYTGSSSYNPDFEMIVKVIKVPIVINITNIECNEIILNVTDALDLNIEALVDKIHEGYANAGDSVIDYKFDSKIISFSHDYYSKTDDPSYYATGHIVANAGGTTNLTICLTNGINTEKFKCENYTIKITVNKIPTEITAEDINPLKVDDVSNVVPTFFVNGTQATTTLIYESSNETVVNFTSDGQFKAVGAGTAILTVRFAGNNTHEASSKDITVTVTKYETSTTVTSGKELSLKVDETSQISAILNPDVGTLEYFTADESIAKVTSAGLITAVGNGTTTITVRYSGDRRNAASEDTITVTITKYETVITADNKVLNSTDEDVDMGATVNVVGEYTLYYSSSNMSVVTVSDDGKLTAIGGGEAQITITYAESQKYLSSTKIITVTVLKIATEMSAETGISTKYGKQISINPTVNAKGSPIAIGTVTYFIDGTPISDAVTLGNDFTFAVDRVGKFNITAKYAENPKYEASEFNISITSNKADNIITVLVDDETYPNSIIIKVNATVAGTYTVDINGTSYDVVANDTIGKSVKLAAGSYYANITGYSSDFYNEIITNDTFTVEKGNVELVISFNDVIYGKNVTATLRSNVEGSYTIKIGDTEPFVVELFADEDYKMTRNIPLDVAQYNVEISIAESENYTAKSAVDTFDVLKAETDFNASVIKTVYYYGEKVVIQIEFPEDATGNVTFNYTDGTYIGEIRDVTQNKNFTVPISNIGEYKIDVWYNGDKNYFASNETVNFEVVRAINSIEVTVEDVIYPNGIAIKVTATVPGKYAVDINGTVYDVIANDTTGLYVKLTAGFYYANITGYSSPYYVGMIRNTTFEVAKAINVIVVNVDNKVLPGNVTVKVNSNVPGTYTVKIADKTVDVEVGLNGEGNATVMLPAGENYHATVIYANENYTAVIKNATFNVSKAINNILIEADDVPYNVNATIKVTADVDGKYAIKINNTIVMVNVKDGFGFNTVKLDPGLYFATTEYEDENYKGNVTSASFNVLSPFMGNLTIRDAAWPENATVYVTGKGEVNIIVEYYLIKPEVVIIFDTIQFNISGQLSSVEVLDQQYVKFNFTVDKSCTVTVDAIYEANDLIKDYKLVSNIITYNVLVKNSTVSISADDINYTSNATLKIRAGEDGLYEVTAANKTYEVNVSNGVASINLGILPAGEYKVEIISKADESIKNQTSFKVSKADDTDMDVTVNNGELSINDSSNATGTVTVTINGTDYEVELVNGTAKVDLDLYPGEYNATITYSGDAVSVEIINKTTSPEFDINLPNDASGNLTVIIDGVDYHAEIVNGSATINPGDLVVGPHEVTVLYSGDGKYAPIENTSVLEIEKIVIPIDEAVNCEIIQGSTSAKYTFTLPEYASSSVTVTIDGKQYNVSIDSGNAVIEIDDLSVGDHNVTIVYAGDERYAPINVTSVLNVPKVAVDENAISVDVSGNSIVVTVDLPSDATGNVAVIVDGVKYDATVENGKATVNVDNLSVGIHNVTATYFGDDKYAPVSRNVTSNIPKEDVPEKEFTVDVNLPVGSKNPKVTVKLPKDATGYALVNVNGYSYYSPVENGDVIITIPGLGYGAYDVSVTYSGDGKYNSADKNFIINIQKPVLKSRNIQIRYTCKYPYRVLVTVDGNAVVKQYVIFKFNGKTYKRLTNNKGYATLKLPIVAPKTYKITATFKGVSVSKNVKVGKIVVAYNKKIKKSARFAKIKVRLAPVAKKYLAGKHMVLKLNGKTFKAITNKKGVATFTISKKFLAMLKVGKVYKYKVRYAKDSVVRKITVLR